MANQEILVEYLESFLAHIKKPVQIEKDSSIESIIETVLQSFQETLADESKIKSNLMESLRTREIDLKHLSEDLQDKEKIIESQKNTISKLKTQIENLENKSKKDLQKITEERDSAKKDLIKNMSVESHFKHELKKKDLEIVTLKNKLRKSLDEKNLKYRNSEEISIFNSLESKNLGNEEFYKFLKVGYSESQQQMVLVNQKLWGIINKIFGSIENVLNDSGFQVKWKSLNVEMIDFIESEVEFRLNDFESCMKNVQRVDCFDGFYQESISALIDSIGGYQNLLESIFEKWINC
jgi:predicted RNase H-like nuclease (RuvC/YqgF family)